MQLAAALTKDLFNLMNPHAVWHLLGSQRISGNGKPSSWLRTLSTLLFVLVFALAA